MKKGVQITDSAEGNRLTSAVQNSKSQIGGLRMIQAEKSARPSSTALKCWIRTSRVIGLGFTDQHIPQIFLIRLRLIHVSLKGYPYTPFKFVAKLGHVPTLTC